MKNKDGCGSAILVLVCGILMWFALWYIQYSRGYHLEWSSGNFRLVWVDKEGRP